MRYKSILLTACCGSVLGAGPAGAATDPIGDFLATYTGAANANLDIIATSATFDGAAFMLSTTMNGPIAGAAARRRHVLTSAAACQTIKGKNK